MSDEDATKPDDDEATADADSMDFNVGSGSATGESLDTDTDEGADEDGDPDFDHDGGDGGGAPHDDGTILLDETEYGAVKDGIGIKAWQLDGLLREDGKLYSPLHLRRNPPKLTFKRRVSDEDYADEYSVYLDKTSARMLRDAMVNVCNAYEFKPVEKKHGKWTWQGFKDSVYDGFMDNPARFLAKAALAVVFVIILIAAVINLGW